jgi:predicted DNA-binding protein with PD1-like motif
MYKCFRLTKGMDLKAVVEKYSIDNKISGVIISSVGSLSHVAIRLAGVNDILQKDGKFEIVSITGTLSPDGVHIHISVADEFGNTIGGHLKDGCIVNTTAEVCLLIFDNISFSREFDESTGYEELIVHDDSLDH